VTERSSATQLDVAAGVIVELHSIVDELLGRAPLKRVALRWPDEVAAVLGVSRTWLYESGLRSEIRCMRHGTVRLVAVSELERVLAKLSARWDE
jgi:hypothetical protein